MYTLIIKKNYIIIIKITILIFIAENRKITDFTGS